MTSKEVESRTYTVPINQGMLLADILRKFAIRGTFSWQIIAYNVGDKSGTYGLASGLPFSVLELFKGKLSSKKAIKRDECIIETFSWDGYNYSTNDSKIVDIPDLGIPAMSVCLLCATGAHTLDQNLATIQAIGIPSSENFVIVPSNHAETAIFKYKVEPVDLRSESLTITASKGVIDYCISTAIATLGSLQNPIK